MPAFPFFSSTGVGHIGGNCWSKTDAATGIEYHAYGSHIFHTSSDEVWHYLNGFGEFTDYRHRVFTVHRGQVYSMPINLGTICAFFGRHLTPADARELIESEIKSENIVHPANLEEKAISLVGRSLYEAFIKGYTAKQWQTDPRLLPASIIARLPVRLDFNDYYFSDKYQGLPREGYTALICKMLSSRKIKIELNSDFLRCRQISVSRPTDCLYRPDRSLLRIPCKALSAGAPSILNARRFEPTIFRERPS